MTSPSSFSLAPSDLELTTDEIHIWYAALDQPGSRFQRLGRLLSVDERRRAERFRLEQDRNRFIVGRGILRTILGYYLRFEPKWLQFRYGENGKPTLADTFGNGTIRFNMSRSEGLALYGFTRDREIGIDIEQIYDIPEMDLIVERFFSVREHAIYRRLPKRKRKEAFFSCWTRKEALLKAMGDGFSQPLDTFEVSMAPREPPGLITIDGDSKGTSRWFIQDLKPAPGFAAAFAVEGRNWQLHCWQWSG